MIRFYLLKKIKKSKMKLILNIKLIIQKKNNIKNKIFKIS